jgi:DNA-binding Lrp family transcriptional regulator
MIRGVDWLNVRKRLEGTLIDEDIRLLEYLLHGASTPEIARMMNKHRSWVWRRAKALALAGKQ